MTDQHTGLPLCQHILIGLDLLHIRETLIADHGDLLNRAYPKTSAARARLNRAIDAVDNLRCELDNLSAREHPGPEWSPNIYYGANAEAWREVVLPAWRKHQAGNPGCSCANTPEPTR